MNVKVTKALSTDSTVKAEDTIIEIVLDMGTTEYINFDADAAKIVDALTRSLPGGTIDYVLIKLLEHCRSKLLVRHK